MNDLTIPPRPECRCVGCSAARAFPKRQTRWGAFLKLAGWSYAALAVLDFTRHLIFQAAALLGVVTW